MEIKTPSLEVLFAPAEFAALDGRDLTRSTCVVFDVLRATTTMVTALANGASAIIPAAEIPESLELQARNPGSLLAGERDGLRIRAELTGGVDFDLGNSPREFTREKMAGKTVVMTTTNGTRALRACAPAQEVLVCAFVNLDATARHLRECQPAHLLLVCGGTFEQMAYEDILAAGALCNLVWPHYCEGAVADSALVAREIFDSGKADLFDALSKSRNGRRLIARPELSEDVRWCARRDVFPLVTMMQLDGRVVAK
jgi:2-phosphosulfolactate phosphatase